jgi:hypothetical protein
MEYLDSDSSTDPGNCYNWAYPAADVDTNDDWVQVQRANSLVNYAKSLEEDQKDIHLLNLWHYQLYSNRFLSSFDWGTGSFTQASLQPVSRTTDNVILQVVDGLIAEIGKARPKAKPVLFGASYKDNQAARKLDKFLYGEFIRNNIYEEAKLVLLNSFICGFGCAKVEIEDSDKVGARVKIRSIFPDDVLIDNQEFNNTGGVYTFVHRRVLPAKTVKATYTNLTDEQIRNATSSTAYTTYRSTGTDWVVVVEGYRVATDEYPGRHMIAIQGAVIKDEVWEHTWLPFVFYHWSRPNKTFYTAGVVEQALPNQVRLNDINDVIHRCQDLVSKPRLLVAQGSRINPLEINNLIAKIIMYSGGIAPTPLKWDAVPMELYNEREREIQICFAKFGLNQHGAEGGLPQVNRIDSSPALREYDAIQDNRLSDPTQRYENFFLEIAKTAVRVIKASGKSPKTVWYSGGRRSRAEVINWEDINLDENAYTMILEAASSFSMTPSAMRDDLESQLQQGLITPQEYQRELGSPDMDTVNSLASEGIDDIRRVVELLEEGEYESPIKEQDLINGVKIVQLRLLALNRFEEDDELVQIKFNFINWLTEARMWLKQATEDSVPPPPTPGAGGMGPQMPLMAPPIMGQPSPMQPMAQ